MKKPYVKKIRALMILNDLTNKKLAKELHVTDTWISLVINGHKRGPRIRKAIAAAVGKSVEELWPNGNNEAA